MQSGGRERCRGRREGETECQPHEVGVCRPGVDLVCVCGGGGKVPAPLFLLKNAVARDPVVGCLLKTRHIELRGKKRVSGSNPSLCSRGECLDQGFNSRAFYCLAGPLGECTG